MKLKVAKERKTRRVQVALQPSLVEAMDAFAAGRGETRTRLIEASVESYMEAKNVKS